MCWESSHRRGKPNAIFGKTNLKATRGPTVHQATQAHAEMRQECVPVRSARKRKKNACGVQDLGLCVGDPVDPTVALRRQTG